VGRGRPSLLGDRAGRGEVVTYPGIENDQALLASMDADFAAVEARRKEREEEFGEWVAVQPIPWGTVLAATPGTPIDRDRVNRLKWDELGLVARRDSAQGREVLRRTGTATPEELERWAAEDKAAEDKAAAKKSSGGKSTGAKDTTTTTTTTTEEGGS
jgi:hypothetical protein